MEKDKKAIVHDEERTDKDMIVQKGMPLEIISRHENDSDPDTYDLKDPKQVNAD
jgi:hypothetical protein